MTSSMMEMESSRNAEGISRKVVDKTNRVNKISLTQNQGK